MIRILIVDDHPLVRRGLKSLLEVAKNLSVVGEAADSISAQRAALELAPDIILLDIKMPGQSGIDVIPQIIQAAPKVKIMVLSAYDNEDYLLEALRLGASAYLLKNTADDMLVKSIYQVYNGKRVLSPSLMDKVLEGFQNIQHDPPKQNVILSNEHICLLKLISQGLTNREIAMANYWSERTTKRKITEVLDILDVKNRAQAVAEAIRTGLI